MGNDLSLLTKQIETIVRTLGKVLRVEFSYGYHGVRPIRTFIQNLFISYLVCLNAVAAASQPDLVAELEAIQQSYKVPGISVVVSSGGIKKALSYELEFYSGVMTADGELSINKSTYFPIASLTKVFSSNLLLSLADQDKLDLNDPAYEYFSTEDSNALVISDLLSHTQIGESDRPFFYDPRFFVLSRIIENKGNAGFQKQLTTLLRSDFPASNFKLYNEQAAANDNIANKLATGHVFDGDTKPMPHDFGVSASAGLIATPKDLVQAGVSLMQSYTSSNTQLHVFNSYPQSKGYANGWFKQMLAGVNLYWSYGQYDGFAALWIIAPESEQQLVMLANNNTLSDASRLIFGDLTASPFASFFAQHFLCETECSMKEEERSALHRDVFFSRYDKQSYNDAVNRLQALYPSKRAWMDNADLNLLHLSNYLFRVSRYLDYPAPNWAEHELAFVESRIDTSYISQPYFLYYAANVYQRAGRNSDARDMFERLVELKNMPSHWTLNEAKAWLKQNPKD
jgi:CubicO group peptidase (beta-lactamase class C family)